MKRKCCKMEIGLWKLYAIDIYMWRSTQWGNMKCFEAEWLYIVCEKPTRPKRKGSAKPPGLGPSSTQTHGPLAELGLLYIWKHTHIKIQHHDSLMQTIIRSSKHMFHNYLNLQEKSHILILIFILCFIIGYYSHF